MLTDHEINLKHYLKERLVYLLREEELPLKMLIWIFVFVFKMDV
jgi:hypothetical protein